MKSQRPARTASQLENDPLPDQASEPPTVDELLASATDAELDRIANGEDPEAVIAERGRR